MQQAGVEILQTLDAVVPKPTEPVKFSPNHVCAHCKSHMVEAPGIGWADIQYINRRCITVESRRLRTVNAALEAQ